MDEIFQRLKEAASTGEIVEIIYHEGSQSGSVRDLSPIRVTRREMMARELVTGVFRNFLLEWIELPNEQSTAPRYDPALAAIDAEPDSLREACEEDIGGLEGLGWHVKLTEDEISLHRYFKNGKPRKAVDVRISYTEGAVSRTYYVLGPSLTGARAFGRLTSAIQLFAEEAVKHAPGKNP